MGSFARENVGVNTEEDYKQHFHNISMAQSAGAVEYTDYSSSEEQDSPNES